MAEPLSTSAAPAAHVPSGPNPDGIGRSRAHKPGDILRALSRARRTVALYDANHPMVSQTLGEAHQVIEHFLAARASLRLFIHDDTFFLENTVLLEESLQLYSFLESLKEREIGSIELRAGLEPWEVGRFVEVLNLRAPEVHRQGGATAHLEQHNVRHISVGRIQPLPPGQRAIVKREPRDAYRAGLRAMDELNFQASRELPLELHKARVIVSSLIDIVAHDKVALMAMSALKNYDEDTCHHSVNVSILSLLMGLKLGLDRTTMTTLGLSALLHDIGKMRIPREILTKAGTLTAEEREVIRRHTLYGARLLRDLPHPARLAMVVAFEHHANCDLSGYPRITTKTHTHLLSRFVQIADFFDAATSSRRIYRRPMLPHDAMRFVLEGVGQTFDPVLARVFIEVMGVYPVGSVVELDTGELAVVIHPGERKVARPAVSVFKDRSGMSVTAYRVSLESQRELHIVRALDPVDVGVDISSYL